MYLYVELWKPRPKWLALSPEQRATYVAQIGPHIESLLREGIELIGFALNDAGTPQRADYAYLAAWKMPSRALVEKLEADGFHEYFEQINARGPLVAPPTVLEHMVRQ